MEEFVITIDSLIDRAAVYNNFLSIENPLYQDLYMKVILMLQLCSLANEWLEPEIQYNYNIGKKYIHKY